MRRWHKLRVRWFWWPFIRSDVCTEGRNPTSKLGMRESMGGDFFQGAGGMAYFWGIFHPFPSPPIPPGNYCTVPKTWLVKKIIRLESRKIHWRNQLPVFLAKSSYDDKAFFIFEYLNRLRCVKPRFWIFIGYSCMRGAKPRFLPMKKWRWQITMTAPVVRAVFRPGL